MTMRSHAVRWLATGLVIAGCASRTPLGPTTAAAPTTTHEPVTATVPAPDASVTRVPPAAPTPSIEPPAFSFDESSTLTFPANPRYGAELACNGRVCLVLWEEMGLTRVAFYGPPNATRGPLTLLPAHPRFSVRATALVAHGEGFAFLRWVDEAFERGRLEVVVVRATGEIDRRVDVGRFYSNSGGPVLASGGDVLLVGYPVTRTSVAFVEVRGTRLGASQRTSSPHASAPLVAYDGQRFVTAWIDWLREGPAFRVRPFGETRSPATIPYCERTTLACLNGACLLVGTRNARIVAEVLTADAAREVVLVDHIGLNGTARVLLRDPLFVTVVDGDGARALEIAPDASVRTSMRAMPPDIGRLEPFGEHDFASLRVGAAPDYDPMFYPCPGDESSTCADVPAHYVLTLRLLRAR